MAKIPENSGSKSNETESFRNVVSTIILSKFSFFPKKSKRKKKKKKRKKKRKFPVQLGFVPVINHPPLAPVLEDFAATEATTRRSFEFFGWYIFAREKVESSFHY